MAASRPRAAAAPGAPSHGRVHSAPPCGPRDPPTRGGRARLPQRVARGQALNQCPGTMPGIADLPSGCAYHPRCERAIAGCQINIPVLEAHGSRRISCFRPLLAGSEA